MTYPPDGPTGPQGGSVQWDPVPSGPVQWGSAIGGPQPPPVWQQPTPAHKPGVVPLRPLDTRDLIDATFSAIRFFPGITFGITAGLTALLTVISAVIAAVVVTVESGGHPDLTSWLGAMDNDWANSLIGAAVVALAAGPLAYPLNAAAAGVRTTWAELWAQVRPVVWRILAVALVLCGVFCIPDVLVLALDSLTGGDDDLVVAATLLVGVAAIIPTIWVTVRIALAPAAVVIERLGPLAAIRRSATLTHRSFWRYFVVLLLIWIVSGILNGVLGMASEMISDITGSGGVAALVFAAVLAPLITALVSPVEAIATSLLHVDARIRREGYDHQLARIAAARGGPW